MVKYVKFKQFLVENDIKRKDIAKLLGISLTLTSSKLNTNKDDFTLKQIRTLCNKYDLDSNVYFIRINQ